MSTVWLNNVTVPVPAGWEDRSQVIVVGPAGGGFRPNFVVVYEEIENQSIEQFAARQLDVLRQTFNSLSLVKEGLTSIGPHHGFLRDYTFVEGQQFRQAQFHVLVGTTVFTMTFSHIPSLFGETWPVIEQSIAEVELPEAGLEPFPS